MPIAKIYECRLAPTGGLFGSTITMVGGPRVPLDESPMQKCRNYSDSPAVLWRREDTGDSITKEQLDDPATSIVVRGVVLKVTNVFTGAQKGQFLSLPDLAFTPRSDHVGERCWNICFTHRADLVSAYDAHDDIDSTCELRVAGRYSEHMRHVQMLGNITPVSRSIPNIHLEITGFHVAAIVQTESVRDAYR